MHIGCVEISVWIVVVWDIGCIGCVEVCVCIGCVEVIVCILVVWR